MRRLFWTMGQLRSGHPFKATDLAQKWEVGLRTAYRDIDFIRDEWRAPVEFDRSRNGYVLTDPVHSLPTMTLSQGELLALFFAERLVALYRGTPYGPALQSALAKLESHLPDELRLGRGSLDAFLSLDLGPVLAPDPDVFDAVARAMASRRRLKLRYKSLSSNRTRDRILEPYRVFNYRGDWYVVAFDDVREDLREFALHRMRRPAILEEAYEIDPRSGSRSTWRMRSASRKAASRSRSPSASRHDKRGGFARGSGTARRGSRKGSTGAAC